MRDIFAKRVAFKPFEYPEVMGYKDAINHSYWLVTEWNFIGDLHDFNTRLGPVEQEVIRRTLLAISQVEVSVKKFWSKLGDRFPKAEFDQVGVTFGESEIRHADAYSHLLQVLGLNGDFAALLKVPAITRRVDYLTVILKNYQTDPDRDFALVLAMFSAFVENVSLFSQFAIIKSFNKHLTVLKDIDNVVQATQKEELIHALFGVYLFNQIREEHPEWFNADFFEWLENMALEAYEAECRIIDWIFETGTLPFLQVQTLKDFIAHRLNESLKAMGARPFFKADPVPELDWFNEEIHAEVSTDFFHKRPVTYSKKTQAIQAEDLF